MMTPEEIQQVVEDYRKSNSLNEEIFSKKVQNFFRNFGRNPKDKVNIEKDKEKNGNGAQGATNGAQGAQSSTTGAQGAQSNDNVGAQGNGAQSSSTGAQGAQGAQSTGAQGAQTNTVKKNEIDLDAISKYSRKGKEVTIKDFGGLTGAQGAQTNVVQPKISPATYSTNQRQTRELVKSGELKDTDLNKYSRSNTYTADDGNTQVNRSTVNTIAQFDMGPNIKKGDKLGVIPNNLRKKYDLKAANFKPEAYDLVLDYVLSEGHADTVEEAHYVMMQMDSKTIQEIVALDENLANVARTAGVLTLGGMGLNAIRKMLQNKKKMDNDGEFTPGSTLDNVQKKNKILKDFNTANY